MPVGIFKKYIAFVSGSSYYSWCLVGSHLLARNRLKMLTSDLIVTSSCDESKEEEEFMVPVTIHKIFV